MEKKLKKDAKIAPAVKSVEKKKEEVFSTYAVMFKIEGHDSWRIGLYPTKEAFDIYLSHPGQKNHPKVTEKRWYVIDRINGIII